MPQTTQVKDMMTDEVLTISPQTSLSEISKLMAEKNFNGLPVVDENKKLLGLVTQYNLINCQAILPSFIEKDWDKFKQEASQLFQKTASDIMEKEPLTLKYNDTYETALALFSSHHRINPVPVIDEEKRLVGIISRQDLLHLVRLFGHT